MVDDLEEAPVLACVSNLRNKFGSINGGREINERDAFSFDDFEVRPVFDFLDEGWIDLSHGCCSCLFRNGVLCFVVLIGLAAGSFCCLGRLVPYIEPGHNWVYVLNFGWPCEIMP